MTLLNRVSAAALAACVLVCSVWGARAASLDYALEATEVAPNVYAVVGKLEHFTRKNGANIMNTGFIVTDDGVVVIDTGPSRRYGEALRELIAAETGQRVVQVYNTHLHPDHMLGNQAFSSVPIAALQGTIDGIRHEGDAFTDALYVMAGDWMRGTELSPPTQAVLPQSVTIGGRDLLLLALSGHSEADLAIIDVASGVLFAGDLAFLGRAPTTPHAELDAWRSSLRELQEFSPKFIVPGHGPIDPTGASLVLTHAYLDWLDTAFTRGAEVGMDMNELMTISMPPEFSSLAVMPQEFHRSVAHLFPAYEQAVLIAAEK